jgi:hypothetical protein
MPLPASTGSAMASDLGRSGEVSLGSVLWGAMRNVTVLQREQRQRGFFRVQMLDHAID